MIIENSYVENTSPSFHFKSRTEHGPFVVLLLSFPLLAWLENSLSSWIPPSPLFPEASQWPSLAYFIYFCHCSHLFPTAAALTQTIISPTGTRVAAGFLASILLLRKPGVILPNSLAAWSLPLPPRPPQLSQCLL